MEFQEAAGHGMNLSSGRTRNGRLGKAGFIPCTIDAAAPAEDHCPSPGTRSGRHPCRRRLEP
ncbi:hypothetical protein STRIP9103_05104 [Streptomyces ipomoeae 91-03]|uniref:Uncharacterized protein n=1 Tax=Streptomyces ipomoeae 91-03 TaxID=698759 RepID=L1KS77_9ACTN|nr:hypothetical protein STRIP9103_05104 [Streptomyces ipomoeae 91-03]